MKIGVGTSDLADLRKFLLVPQAPNENMKVIAHHLDVAI